MDKTIIKEMKAHADYVFRAHKDGAMNIQACQAYAELCKAEALERIADAMEARTAESIISEMKANELMREMFKDDASNRGDQSIADAISEQVTDPPDEPFKPIRALCIGCDMLYAIEDLTTRSTGRFCSTCYYLEAV